MTLNKLQIELQIKILQLQLILTKLKFHVPMTNSEKLYTEAIRWLGKDASPQDEVDDSVACVSTIEKIYFSAFGEYMCPPKGETSTLRLYQKLKNDPLWRETDKPSPGVLVLSPSGMSSKNYKHGHAGIFMLGNTIASNESRSGLFVESYTTNSWNQIFRDKMGFPVFYFLR